MSTTETLEAVQACPQCNSTTPWGENSWCPECGYYPKFAAHQSPPVETESVLDSDTIVDSDTLLEMPTPETVAQSPLTAAVPDADDQPEAEEVYPNWVKILAAGVIAIMVGSIA